MGDGSIERWFRPRHRAVNAASRPVSRAERASQPLLAEHLSWIPANGESC